ncbi:MAG: DUF58 domain-containing protein [Cytophagales bacterium]|nr:MAG: DUF58 domain-containing protein [Cytophagales bacterium]
MKLFKHLFLQDKIFYLLGGCVFLLFLAFLYSQVFYIAIGFIVIILFLLVTDIILLFRTSNTKAIRKVADILSLHDDNSVIINIENLSKLKLKISVLDEVPHQVFAKDFKVTAVIEQGKNQEISYSIVPNFRGNYQFGDLHLFMSTAIGLVLKKETFFCSQNIAVYPSIYQMAKQELIFMRQSALLNGDNKVKKLGQSYELEQIKLYTSGDDVRNINWKASSTINEVMINCYEDERSQNIYSIIDKSRVMKMPFNELTLFDYAVNASLAFSNIVIKKQDNAGLITFSKEVSTNLKASSGKIQLKRITHALYKDKYDYSEADYGNLYAHIRKNLPNRSLLFLYTNFDSIYSLERNLKTLRLINKNHLLIVVFFQDAELENFAQKEAENLLEIHQITIAKKFILENNLIMKELQKHGIIAIRCNPSNLSLTVINKYLQIKSKGMF